MKKILFSLLALVLTVTCLASCSNGPTEEEIQAKIDAAVAAQKATDDAAATTAANTAAATLKAAQDAAKAAAAEAAATLAATKASALFNKLTDAKVEGALENTEKSYFAVGGWESGWAINSNLELTPTTVKWVKDNTGLDLTEKAANIKYLYVGKVLLGASDAGWATKCMIDGEKYTANGSFTLKVIRGAYDEDDQVWSNDQWISDPKTAHVESLTPTTFFLPTWQEAADANGFSWSDNPVCIGGTGWYYLVFAEYKSVSAADTAGYGIGLVKTTYPAAEAYKLIPNLQVAEVYVRGSFDASWAALPAYKMAYNAETGKLEVTVTFEAETQFKVADATWGAFNFGFSNVGEPGEVAADQGGNIKVAAGTYKITLDADYNITVTPVTAA